MAIKKILIVAILCFCLQALVIFSASAQSVGYTKLNVNGRVQLEIPSDWTINDAEHRKQLSELTEKRLGIPSQYIVSLSVQSYPKPSRMSVRVSFIPMDPSLSQEELRQGVQGNLQQVLKDVADVWQQISPALWAALAKDGVKEIGRPSFTVEPLGGQLALAIRYRRTSAANSAETMNVTQYHVPLGAEEALITLSYIDSDPKAIADHDRLKGSFVIR